MVIDYCLGDKKNQIPCLRRQAKSKSQTNSNFQAPISRIYYELEL